MRRIEPGGGITSVFRRLLPWEGHRSEPDRSRMPPWRSCWAPCDLWLRAARALKFSCGQGLERHSLVYSIASLPVATSVNGTSSRPLPSRGLMVIGVEMGFIDTH